MGAKTYIPGLVTMTLPVEPTFQVWYIENSSSDGPSVTLQVVKGTHGLESLKIALLGDDRAKLLRRVQRVVEAGHIKVHGELHINEGISEGRESNVTIFAEKFQAVRITKEE